MSRDAIEVGAFTWSRIERLYDPDPIVHWQRCESEGLQCPQEVFTQLFHEEATNTDFAAIVRATDYSALRASPLATARGIGLRCPCCAQAQGGHQWPPVRRIRLTPFGRSTPLRVGVGSRVIGAHRSTL